MYQVLTPTDVLIGCRLSFAPNAVQPFGWEVIITTQRLSKYRDRCVVARISSLFVQMRTPSLSRQSIPISCPSTGMSVSVSTSLGLVVGILWANLPAPQEGGAFVGLVERVKAKPPPPPNSHSPYPAPSAIPSPQQHAPPPPNAPQDRKNREGPEKTGHRERDEQGEITGQGRLRSPKTVQSAGGGEGKDKKERIIVVVRSPCRENDPPDAHPSVHKSVLESANPACTRSVHLDAPGQRHGQQPLSRTADSGVVKQDKSSKGSVDTTKRHSDPQRVRMSSVERRRQRQTT